MFALVASRPDDPTLVGGSEPAVPAEPRTSYSERPVARARRAKARELYVPSLGRYPHGHAPAPVRIADQAENRLFLCELTAPTLHQGMALLGIKDARAPLTDPWSRPDQTLIRPCGPSPRRC